MPPDPQSITLSYGCLAPREPGLSPVGPCSCPEGHLTPAPFHLTPEERLGVRRKPFGVTWGRTVLLPSDPRFPLITTGFTSLGSVGSDDSLLKSNNEKTGTGRAVRHWT